MSDSEPSAAASSCSPPVAARSGHRQVGIGYEHSAVSLAAFAVMADR